MTWELEWAEALPALRKLASKGQAVPALESEPWLDDRLDIAMAAFQDLHGSRCVTSAGPQPIGPGAVRDWCDVHGIRAGDVPRRLYRLVSAADRAFFADRARRSPPNDNG